MGQRCALPVRFHAATAKGFAAERLTGGHPDGVEESGYMHRTTRRARARIGGAPITASTRYGTLPQPAGVLTANILIRTSACVFWFKNRNLSERATVERHSVDINRPALK